jgi:hypothetical protein
VRKYFKVFGWILFTIVAFTGLLYLSFIKKTHDYEERVSKIISVNIQLSDDIESLEKIEFLICDSVYFFTFEHLKDTVFENLEISNSHFPCDIHVTYHLLNGVKNKFTTERFNCSGCSGTNSYYLFKDSVQYIYHP